MILYDVRSITHNQKPGHGTINVICVPEIYDAVSLRNDEVRFFYYGQFNEYHMIGKTRPYSIKNTCTTFALGRDITQRSTFFE